MLVDEFGKDYGIYFSILTLISQGKTTRSELENALISRNCRDIKNLSERVWSDKQEQPLYERSVNKNVHYTIEDQFLRFWFRFGCIKYSHIIEAGANEKLKSIAERDFRQ